ncbi:hypothetical protein D3C87_1903070 [compost metagenome]
MPPAANGTTRVIGLAAGQSSAAWAAAPRVVVKASAAKVRRNKGNAFKVCLLMGPEGQVIFSCTLSYNLSETENTARNIRFSI